MPNFIEIESLTKQYRSQFGAKLLALQDVSFSVGAGETFGFIGPNGAGKSTTIKILTGVIKKTSGKALLFDKPVDDYRARIGMSYVPENPYLYDYLTPMEILRMGLAMHKVKVDDPQKHCLGWLERFGIADVANKRIRSFSKGMTQRTALAHALATQPKLLILDEPLSGLDPIGRKEVVDILMQYRQEGGTLFFSSHVLYDVERLADRFGLIHKGELKTVQSPNELLGEGQRYVIRSIGHTPVSGMQADVGDRWYGECGEESLWQHLHDLEAAGHQLLEIKPGLSLEAAFLKYVGAAS